MNAEAEADIREGSGYREIHELPDAIGFQVIRPASIKKKKLGQAKFNELSKKVSDIAEDIIGVSFDQWKAMGKQMTKDARRAA
jgi:hypothetical protein